MRLAVLIGVCLLGCGRGQVTGQAPAKTQASVTTARAPSRSTADLARLALPHVVSIEADSAQGSGLFITEALVVTCFHVVRGARSIRLKAPGWHGEAIAVVGWDEPDDLAILRITPRRHTKGLRLSNQLAPIGTKVVVVSSPLGLENTVSDG